MDPGVFLSIVEVLRDDLLAVAVGEEVDGAGGDGADQGRPETFEECSRGLFAVYIPATVSVLQRKRQSQTIGEGRYE